jgi:hypothetical protein
MEASMRFSGKQAYPQPSDNELDAAAFCAAMADAFEVSDVEVAEIVEAEKTRLAEKMRVAEITEAIRLATETHEKYKEMITNLTEARDCYAQELEAIKARGIARGTSPTEGAR